MTRTATQEARCLTTIRGNKQTYRQEDDLISLKNEAGGKDTEQARSSGKN
jgi:hypothetical protein